MDHHEGKQTMIEERTDKEDPPIEAQDDADTSPMAHCSCPCRNGIRVDVMMDEAKTIVDYVHEKVLDVRRKENTGKLASRS